MVEAIRQLSRSSRTRAIGPPRSAISADGRSHGPVHTASDLISRVQPEGGLAFLRQAEVDGVAEVVAGEPELEAHRAGAPGPGPHRRGQAALSGQRTDRTVARHVGQQTKRSVQTGFAAAVRPRHDRAPPKRHHQPAQRPVVRHGKGVQHALDLIRARRSSLSGNRASPPARRSEHGGRRRGPRSEGPQGPDWCGRPTV